jgi:hypothetical protein
MPSKLRKSLCIVLAFSLALAPALPAQQAGSAEAPVPAQIAAAHTIFVSNGGGSPYFSIFTGGPDRAYDTFYADLQKTGRYQLVSAPGDADLIFEIRAIAPAESGPHDTVTYLPQFILSIFDPKTHTMLWTTRANVRALGMKRRRNRQFDASVAVLMDKLSEVTGQPLSPSQLKAVNDNSRMPSAAKVFLFAALAAGVGMTAYGIYRVTHPPTLPPLTQPAESPFPASR